MTIVVWGTYDLTKPRTRILLRGLRAAGTRVIECHADVWTGIEDKSRISGRWDRFRLAFRWLRAYPNLVLHYLRLPPHEAVLVGYLGDLDVLVLWPFARLRRVPIVWDAFVSLYDTVVNDRKLVAPHALRARLLHLWEWLACRAADRVLVDTHAHARYFREEFGLAAARTGVALVGAEPEVFGVSPASRPAPIGERLLVLFYGQLIPLHGLDVILEAAARSADDPFDWLIIGSGQEEERLLEATGARGLRNVRWLPWVAYDELPRWIGRADVCLGIFGTSGKARRVIPNKVFQSIAAGKPIVTADTPAIRELLDEGPTVHLVPPGDPDALVDALRRFHRASRRAPPVQHNPTVLARIQPRAIGLQALELFEDACRNAAPAPVERRRRRRWR